MKKKVDNNFVADAYESAGFTSFADSIRGAGSMNELVNVAVDVIAKIASTNDTFRRKVNDATNKSETDTDERQSRSDSDSRTK